MNTSNNQGKRPLKPNEQRRIPNQNTNSKQPAKRNPQSVQSDRANPYAYKPMPKGAKQSNMPPQNAGDMRRESAAKSAQRTDSRRNPNINSASQRKQNPNTAEKPRRRNEESYVFSRSLSETRERILEERRERLEDARQFRKEDVSSKLKKGLIAFVSTLLVIAIVASVSITIVMNSGKVKKSSGEYTYKIGQNNSYETYVDKDRRNVLYISMNSLAELCNFSITGSESNLRFTTENSKNFIAFSKNSSDAKINGFGFAMEAPAIIEGRSCFIPLNFVDLVFDGLRVSVDEKSKTVSVLRKEYNDSTPIEPHYVDISFMLKDNSYIPSLNENKYFEGQPIFSFKNNLESYEKYMNPQGDQKDAFLILVNKDNPIGSTYEPENLVEVKNNIKDYWLVDTAAKAVEALLMEMHSEGFTDIFVTSAYRSYRKQHYLFYDVYVEQERLKHPDFTEQQLYDLVATYSAVPGTSEHHSGLCVDFMSTHMKELDNEFEKNEAFEWLMANAWKFGFILRYPEDKVDITKYSYESWHWRFVGRSHALEIMRQGICFEEYLEILNQQ